VVSTIFGKRWGVMSGMSIGHADRHRGAGSAHGGRRGGRFASAKRTASAHGATVLRAIAGSMLLEAPPSKAAAVAKALPGWRYSPERKTTRVPERRPLERLKMAKVAA